MVSIEDLAEVNAKDCSNEYKQKYIDAEHLRNAKWGEYQGSEINEKLVKLMRQKLTTIGKWAYRKGKRGREAKNSMKWAIKMWFAQEKYAGKVPPMHRTLYPSLVKLYDGDETKIPVEDLTRFMCIGLDESFFIANIKDICGEAEAMKMVGNDLDSMVEGKTWEESKEFYKVRRQLKPLKLPEGVCEVLTEAQSKKDKESGLKVCGCSVNFIPVSGVMYPNGKTIHKIVELSTSKEEADNKLREYGENYLIYKAAKGAQKLTNTIKVNAWLLNMTEEEVKTFTEKEGLTTQYYYNTEAEGATKAQFLYDNLRNYQKAFIVGRQLNKDGSLRKIRRKRGDSFVEGKDAGEFNQEQYLKDMEKAKKLHRETERERKAAKRAAKKEVK